MLIWGKKSLHYHSIKRQQKQQNQHTDISRLLDRLLENYVKKVQTLGLVQILHYNQLVSESDLHACYNSSFKVIVNYFRIFVMNTKFENYLFNNGIKIEFILKWRKMSDFYIPQIDVVISERLHIAKSFFLALLTFKLHRLIRIPQILENFPVPVGYPRTWRFTLALSQCNIWTNTSEVS